MNITLSLLPSTSSVGLGMIGQILDWFEHLFRDQIEGELNTVVCSELVGLADDALDQLLLDLSSQIDTYLVDTSAIPGQGVMSLENSLQVPTTSNEDGSTTPLYLNFQDMGAYAGDWIDTAIEQIDNLFAAEDSYGGLAINALIRENILDDEGLLQVDPSMFFNENILDTHDMSTETTMSMKSIKVAGLDSFVEMDILNPIGKYTLGNSLKLQYLWIEVEMDAVM